jgi:hypothetical protein
MSVEIQRTTRRHIPEDDTLHNHRCGNLKFYNVTTNSMLQCICRKASSCSGGHDITRDFNIGHNSEPVESSTQPINPFSCSDACVFHVVAFLKNFRPGSLRMLISPIHAISSASLILRGAVISKTASTCDRKAASTLISDQRICIMIGLWKQVLYQARV